MRKFLRKGDVLITLFSRDLQHRIEQVKIAESVSRWEAEHQPFDEKMLTIGQVFQRRFEEAGTELEGRLKESEQFTMHAPFSGYILTRNEEIQSGLMLPPGEQLYVLVDTTENKVDVFVGSSDLKRISIGNSACFIPDGPEFEACKCRVTGIDSVNIPVLEESSLASVYGGPIASNADAKGQIRPVKPHFRIRLGSCKPANAPKLCLKGVAGIEAGRQSLAMDIFRRIYDVFLRESGF